MSPWPFVAIVVLLAVNGFFVALEFALIGSRRSRLEPLAEAGDKGAQRGLEAMRDLSIQLAGAQLGITIASLILGLVGEPAMAHLLEPVVDLVPFVPDGWAHGIAGVIGLVIVVFAHMVLGEMVPKNLTLTHPEATLRVISLPNKAYLAVARPLVWALNVMANLGVQGLRRGAPRRAGQRPHRRGARRAWWPPPGRRARSRASRPSCSPASSTSGAARSPR